MKQKVIAQIIKYKNRVKNRSKFYNKILPNGLTMHQLLNEVFEIDKFRHKFCSNNSHIIHLFFTY